MWWNKFNLLIYQKADDVYKVPIKSELTLDSQSLQELRLKSQYHVLILTVLKRDSPVPAPLSRKTSIT